ncbi:hypothetical protein [Streptosporangium sp. NPDC023615]|uniref:hypothetical protein n=1 Tax=Streptosporangium sp. NPDC023615 TaxID=3154794 RepID=UPI003439766E
MTATHPVASAASEELSTPAPETPTPTDALTLTMQVTYHDGHWIALPGGAADGVPLAGGLSGLTLTELQRQVEAAKRVLCGVGPDVAVAVRYTYAPGLPLPEVIDSASVAPCASRTCFWYDRLNGIYSELSKLRTLHGRDDRFRDDRFRDDRFRDDRFRDELAELAVTLSELYAQIETGTLQEAEAQAQTAELAGRLSALTTWIYTDGRTWTDEETLHLALVLWADGSPFCAADLDGVLAATGQSWTWLLARLGERVVTGLLAYDTATGYRVADPAALKALLIPNVSATAPLALWSALQAERARDARRDAVTRQDELPARPATAPDPIHPTMAALTGSCLVCGYPVWPRTAVRARTAFGMAMVALFAAALTGAPAALTIALLAVFAITGLCYLRLAPAPCRHRR